MIYTLTLSPCIDRTVTVENFRIGKTNRSSGYIQNVRGKGINTSLTLRNLGYTSEVFAFDPGEVSPFLKSAGIKCNAVHVPGQLRLNIKINDVASGTVTELNEKSSPVSSEALEEMLALVDAKTKKGDILVVSGSVPPGTPDDLYANIILKAKKKGIYTVLDADGVQLRNGITALPDLIKPNTDELERLTGNRIGTVPEAARAAKKLVASGIGRVCVSMGATGAVLCAGGKAVYAVTKPGAVEGTVGAGDSMIAGFVMAITEKRPPEDMLRWGSAVAAGSVSLPATELCTDKLFREMLSETKFLYI